MATNLNAGLNSGLNPGLRQSISGGAGGLGLFRSSSLDLRFADKETLTDRVSGNNLVTFSRASGGTYVDSDGLIKNSPVNLLTHSEQFDQSVWTKANGTQVTPNAAEDPAGGNTADLLTFTGSTQQLYFGFTPSAGTYTLSVYLRVASGSKQLRIQTYSPTDGVQNKDITVTDTWQRFSHTVVISNTQTTFLPCSPVDLGEVYIWGAQLEEGTTATDYIPTGATVGGAPRFDHDPVTGESLGLLIEEERTNVVRYNSMSGAVPGVYGSGGSLPTGWSVAQQQPGTQLEIIGTGVERGIEYIDLRFFGTATSNQLWLVQPNGSTDIPVGTTDDWTSSVYGKVVAGDLSELNVATYSVVQGASGVVLKTGLTSEFTRLAGTGVSPSANRKARVAVGADQDQSYDVTMRLGGFQGERGEFATSFIPTNGSQVTRAADLASIQGSNFTDAGWFNQSEGTVFVQCGSFAELQSTEGRKIFQILESNATLHSISYRNNKKDDYTINTKVSGSRLFSPVEAGDPNHFDDKIGYAYSSTGGSVIHQGSAISSSTTDLSVIDADRLNLGTPSLNGHIKRFAYFPVRKTDQELIGLTGS